MSTAPAFLLITIDQEIYAIAGGAVREVIRWRAPTPVPGAPPELPGIISQRGVVVPMVDLRVLLGRPAQAPDRATRLVLLHHSGIDLALLVDAVRDLQELPAAFDPPPAGHTPTARLTDGVLRGDDQPIARLDLGAVLAAVSEGSV